MTSSLAVAKERGAFGILAVSAMAVIIALGKSHGCAKGNGFSET